MLTTSFLVFFTKRLCSGSAAGFNMESAKFLCLIGVVLAFINTGRCENGHLDIMPRFKVVSKAVGEKLALTCKPVVEKPDLITQIEWLDPKNRRIDSNSRNHLYLQNLPLDTGLMVVFPSLTEEQKGTYTCVAKYANNNELRANVTVETYEDITFVNAPENQYPVIDRDYIIKCEVKGNPPPTVDWYKNDVNIVTQERYIVQPEGGLLIKNVTEADDGTYRCTAVVISTGQIKSKEIKVEVLIPPKIDPIPTASVIEGESAVVKCRATGKPPPKYTWIKEGTSEDLRKAHRFNVKEISGDLIISRVEYNDQSSYKCVAKNEAGETTTSVELKVLVKPRIFELLNITAPVHKETTIVCKANGRPPPNVVFQKWSNKEPFAFGKQPLDQRITLEQRTIMSKGETIATLVISNLNRTDDGLYRCIAKNEAGMALLNGHITVEFPPTFERTKHLPPTFTWGNRPGNISCIPEAIPNATIKWMHGDIEIRESPNFKIEGTSPRSNLIVYPRNEKRFYSTYLCVATNRLGTQTIPLKLEEAFRPKMIMQAKAQSITATTIKFGISVSIQDGLPLRTITVQFKPERELTWDYARNHTWSFGAPYILEDLLPEVTYHFRFAARNDVGMGQWSNTETISMPRRSEPAEPKILRPAHSIIDDNSSNRQDMVAVSPYADRYDIRWNVPNSNGDPIIKYIIRYCRTEKVNGEWRDSDCSEEIEQSVQYTHYELTNLFADTTYKVELRAQNAIGASSPAQIKIKTARGMDPVIPAESPSISSGAIIGIVLAAILLVLLVVDIACFCVNRTGVLAALCYRARSKHDDDDQKLGSLYSWRFPLPYCSYKAAPAHPNSLNLPMPVKLVPTPTDETEPLRGNNQANGETQLSVEYEGGKVYTKPGTITGKHSAV